MTKPPLPDDAADWGGDLPDDPGPEPTPESDPLDDSGRGEVSAGDAPTTRTISEGRPRPTCKVPGCTNPIAEGARKYCADHQPQSHRAQGAPPAQPKARSKPSTRAGDLATVERNAAMFAQAVGGLIGWASKGYSLDPTAPVQHPLLLQDAADIQGGAVVWSKQVRAVAEYEAWLRNLLGGGTASDRAMAWLGLGLSTAGIVMPILLRHEVIPAQVAQMIPTAGAPGEPDNPVSEPAAA